MFDAAPQVTTGTTRPTHPSVNGPALLALADLIESERLGFDVGIWMYPPPELLDGRVCGTAACIGGTAQFMFGIPYSSRPSYGDDVEDKVARRLGINDERQVTLFYPWIAPGPRLPDSKHLLISEQFPRARAVEVVRHLAYTGEVRWDLFHLDGSKRNE